ncbi:MAG: hypothetical protein PHV68_00985 [Candidatus Gastranaerophilales bacterium]|nr:hypothetical protein [Candidatus Gastranaerophilales bacterium]
MSLSMNMMGMQSAAGLSDAQYGLIQNSAKHQQLADQAAILGAQCAESDDIVSYESKLKDIYEQDLALDLSDARLQTRELIENARQEALEQAEQKKKSLNLTA